MAFFGAFRGGRRGEPAGTSGHTAVLDLGATSATCLIARAHPNAAGAPVDIDVLGVGMAANTGMKDGAVSDMDAAEAAIRNAVEEAERTAGLAVSSVSVGFAGGGLTSHDLFGETTLSERPIGDRDLRRALDDALQSFEAEGRVVLHAIPQSWSVDEHRGVRDPRGMFGRELTVDVNVVSAQAGPVRNLQLCLERARLGMRSVVAAPYASGLAVLVPDEMDLGVTVIDMGGGVTSAAVFIEGALVHVDAVPFGGMHVTSDLARVLSMPMTAAERVKRKIGSLAERSDDEDALVDCPQLGEERAIMQAPRALVRDIMRDRVEETLDLLAKRLRCGGVLRAAGPRVVLTGGAALLDGMGGFAAQALGKRVRVARPYGLDGFEGLDEPGYATAAGLLHHALKGPREALSGPPQRAEDFRPRPRPQVARMRQAASWLRENF